MTKGDALFRSIKRLMRTSRAVLFCFLFCCTAVFPAAAEQSPRAIHTAGDADWFVSVLLSGDASSLDGAVLLTEPMAEAVTASGGFQGLANSLASLGGITDIAPAYEYSISGQTAFRIPCSFRTMPLDLMLVTADGALAGLVTMEYSGAAPTAEEKPSSDTGAAILALDLAVPVPTMGGELPGTLTLPEGEGPFPAVILVHGSGPNDRDETVMAQKPFRDLAEGLARHGIAVYRYDKRTFVYGAQLASETQLTLTDETVDDAAAAVNLIARQNGIDPERIFLLGHSLGATAIPAIDRILRSQDAQVCGYILMAGSARYLPELMKEQYDFLYSFLPELSATQQAEKDRLYAELGLLDDPAALPDDARVAGAYAPYWRWLHDYDILSAAAEISVPCLALQGEEDYQVTTADMILWQEALKGKDNWRFISYPGLTHTFVRGLKEEGSAVYARSLHVDQQVIEDIAEFILAH